LARKSSLITSRWLATPNAEPERRTPNAEPQRSSRDTRTPCYDSGMAATNAQLDDRGIIVSCPSCCQRNRVAFGHQGKCKKCGTALPATAEPLEVPSTESFDALVKASKLPVVVDFWAPWCGPCRMVAPELIKVAANAAGKYVVVKVNTDALPDLGDRFAIRSIPTMAVFADGREVARTAGARPARDIEAFLSQAVASPRS
jgi:thioredoxin 2